MLSEQQIKDSVSIAAKEYPIKCVDLFGSYASGKYHQNSVSYRQSLALDPQQRKVSAGGIMGRRQEDTSLWSLGMR